MYFENESVRDRRRGLIHTLTVRCNLGQASRRCGLQESEEEAQELCGVPS